MKQSKRGLSIIIILITGFLLGILGFFIWDKPSSLVEPVVWSPEVQWIAPTESTYRFYARRTFSIPNNPCGGWVRLSADNDFILYVNGQVVAQEVSTLRNTMGLAGQLGDINQRWNDFLPYPSLRPEWVYLRSPRDWKLTSYVDITKHLNPGKNVIAIEVQKGEKSPRLLLEGAVYPVQQEDMGIDLSTGTTSWKVATLLHSRQRTPWFDLNFPDESWIEAKAMGRPLETSYSRVSLHLFNRLLAGSWIGSDESNRGEVWLRGYWQLSEKPKRAWIRWAGKGEYALMINGLLVNRYQADQGRVLHLHEVTNFMHPGVNILAVRLARPIDTDWHTSFNSALKKIEPLGFFLDGWIETSRGELAAEIETNKSWYAVTQPVSGWAEGVGNSQNVTFINPPNPQTFSRAFEGNAYLLNYPDYFLHQMLWCFAGVGFSFVYAFFLGCFWLDCRENLWNSLVAGTGLMLPGTVFLIGIGLLKHRYATSERWLLFANPHSNSLILLGFIGIVLLTLLWGTKGRNSRDSIDVGLTILASFALWFIFSLTVTLGWSLATEEESFHSSLLLWIAFGGVGIAILLTLFWRYIGGYITRGFSIVQQAWPSWGYWLYLVIISIAGFAARAYHIDAMDLEADEYTSLDATRGILSTGAPIATSGIWYTRGPLYHYLLALWLRWVGDSTANARFLSVILGTATLCLVFILTRKVTGNVWLALIVTAILAFDPWQLWYSRFIRFYQVLQFTVILAFWLLFKGFINKEGRIYQHIFYVVITSMLLIQEGSLTLLPGFFLGFLFFYRPFRVKVDWTIVLGSVVTIIFYAYNIIFFMIKCLTPLVAISTSTDSYLKPRLSDVTGFLTNFFVGPNYMNVIYSFFFFIGFIYFIKRKESKIVYFFVAIILNLLLQTVLVYIIAARYFYPLYPIFVMLSIYSAFRIIKSCHHKLNIIEGPKIVLRISLVLMVLIFMGNLEVEKVVGAYEDSIAIRNTEIVEYIQKHKQPGDVVISNTSAVYTPIGGLDYYTPHRLSIFDAVYAKEGIVVDRWGGGTMLTNLDQLTEVLASSNRVWIHSFDRPQPPKDLTYNQIYSFYQKLGQPVFETFGARLRLWQQEDGMLPRVPNEGKDFGHY